MLHRGVTVLQTTKNSIGKGLSQFSYCPKCAGNGVVFVRTDDAKKMVRKTCPLCKGRYYLDLSKGRSDEKLSLTKNAATKMALATRHLEELIKQAKEEQKMNRACCKHCGGKGIVLLKVNGHLKEENCSFCHGTGKDYSTLADELKNRFIVDLVKLGYSKEVAKKKCHNIYPTATDKDKILKMFHF